MGQNIVEFGDQATSYYIITEGVVEALNETGTVIREMIAGAAFGEQALYSNSTRQATIRAKSSVSVMVIARDTLKDILGKNLQEVIYGNSDKWALQKSSVFSRLSTINMEKILQSCIERKTLEAGEVIMYKGKPANKIVICNDGEIEYVARS